MGVPGRVRGSNLDASGATERYTSIRESLRSWHGGVDYVPSMSVIPRVLFALVITLATSPASSQAKSGKDSKPAPRRNAKKGDFAVFPLGPIGGSAEVEANSKEIKILKLLTDGPGARAGLLEGDRIVATWGRPFTPHTRDIDLGGQGPMAALGLAIEKAEGSTPGHLDVTVLRQSATRKIRITLPRLGPLARDYPVDCSKSRSFYDGICRDLLITRRKDGAWRSQTGEDATRYVTALCGLALLGRGDPDHLPALRRVATFLAGPKRRGYVSADLKKPAGLSNWFICVSGIFLAEYVLATQDQQWVPTIQHLCDCLASRQTPAGRYGHGITVGYSGRGFNIINTHAHLLWALAGRAGCRIDDKAWKKSFDEIAKSTGKNGGVRYWTLQTGYWDSCARTGQMALALDLSNRAPELASRMGKYLEKNHLRMREAHAMGSIGMIFGTAALRRVNPAGWRRHMDSWRWYFNLMRQPNRSAEYIGGKRNNGGDHYLRTAHVANAIAGMMLATGFGNLHMCGNDRKGWFRQ